MLVWRSLGEVSEDLSPGVVTIGNFDGVHRGHQHVFAQCRELAATHRLGNVVAVIFDPHPMAVLRPEHTPSMLTTVEDRIELLERAGASAILVLPFDLEMARWSPEQFARQVVSEVLRARLVVVGANFRFGHRAGGDVALLHQLGKRWGFRAVPVELDGGPQVWSSTYIRLCLAAGDVEGAAEALGRPFAVRGAVMRGEQRGRELGFPTANVPIGPAMAAPADGVYAGWLRSRGGTFGTLDRGVRYPAAISVGTNPTFDGDRERRIEAHVLDRSDLELYQTPVEVEFIARLRGMVRFDDAESLIKAMRDDVTRARDALCP
ncbi:MAG: bifunctional riboflavin kinase/FAD synthetase [Nocardioides sp.]